MRRAIKITAMVTGVLVVGAIGVAVVMFGGEGSPPPPTVSVPVDAGTETVVRSDITAVVSIDATVTANAEYVVVAPKDGVVSHVFDPTAAGPQRHVPTADEAVAAALDPNDPDPSPEPSGDPDPTPPDEDPPPTDDETDTEEPKDDEPADSGPAPIAAKRVVATVADKSVTAPVDGVFVEWLVPDGTTVKKGVPIARLTYTGFALVGTMPAIDAYRVLSGKLSATATITDGPSGFDCRLLQAPTSTAPDEDGGNGPSIVCAPADDVKLFNGLSGLIAIHSGQRADVLTLPVSAVSGTAETGEVTLVHDDGTTEIRTVALGATDGIVVEIVDGLAEGDVVSATAPQFVR